MEPELHTDDLRSRVEKGARWLEEHGGEDWPEKILAAVREGEFHMEGDCTCAVGVTLGDYHDHFGESPRSDAEAVRLGFFTSGEWDAGRRNRWADLEREWIDYATEEQRLREIAR